MSSSQTTIGGNIPASSSSTQPLLSLDQPTSSSQSQSGIIEFRGRILDPDAWFDDVKKCCYLPESQMISLCNV